MDGFLGIGFWEILLIFVIVLALLGPRKLPEIAARLGTLFRRLRRASFDLTAELTREVEGTPRSKDDNPLDSLRQAASDLKSSVFGVAEGSDDKEEEGVQEGEQRKSEAQGAAEKKEEDVEEGQQLKTEADRS
jgi:Tat protein translocase TatB subunit